MKKIIITIAIILLAQSDTCAEQVTLKTGESLQGDVMEQTDNYIKLLIDVGSSQIPYTFYLDEIKSIDGKQFDVDCSSPIVQQEEFKPFIDEEYGLKIMFPTGYYVVVGQERIKERIKDIRNWQNFQLNNYLELDPENVMFAKNIANVTAESISYAMTPYFAAYRIKPEKFYSNRRPIPEITIEIRENSRANPLQEELDKINLMTPILSGEFLEPAQIIESDSKKALRYSIRYEDDTIGEVCKIAYVTTHKNMKITIIMTTKPEEYLTLASKFEDVINSLELN